MKLGLTSVSQTTFKKYAPSLLMLGVLYGGYGCGGGSDSATGGSTAGVAGEGGSSQNGGSSGSGGNAGSSGSSGESGSAGTTITSCKPDEDFCGGVCIKVVEDVNNCGSCGHVCDTASNGAATCSAGVCSITCNTGFLTCDNNDPNALCATNVFEDANNCNLCGNVCPGSTNAQGVCSGGSCITACNVGFQDCLLDDPGCETETASDPLNCGGCGIDCPLLPNSVARCESGDCSTECLPGYTDCNPNVDGCETHTAVDTANCGVCNNPCSDGIDGTAACVGGECVLSCIPGKADCNGSIVDGCEMDVLTDPGNCGFCFNACPDSGVCVNGSCQCAGSTAEAQKIPIDVFVILDRSGSMTGSRWTGVTTALKDFVDAPTSSGVGMSLEYFPPLSGGECTAADYANPQVAYGVLPAHSSAIKNSLNSTSPSGVTPTLPAVTGTIQAAKAHQNANPNHKVIVLLATDGEPNGCSSTIDNVANAASSSVNNAPQVPVYVIGIGNVAGLNQVAAAGGTNSAFIVDGGNSAAFLAAMQQIQLQSLGCEFLLPDLPAGEMLDPTKVNVIFTPGGSSSGVLNNVGDANGCNGAGWYYDNAQVPTKILLCPDTCNVIKTDFDAKLEIQLGCPTKEE